MSFFTNAHAQTRQGDLNSWGLLLTRFNFSEGLSVTNEIHGRSREFLDNRSLFIVRPSLDYAPNENVELSIGYSYLRSWSDFPGEQRVGYDENNIWEQLLLKQSVGEVLIQSRFRQEHRYVEEVEAGPGGYEATGETSFSNRFRYRITVSRDIIDFGEQSIFFNVFDELWIDQKGLMPSSFSRNWIYLGLGYKFNPDYNVQLAYLNQFDKTGADTYMSSPVIQLSFFATFSFKD